MLLLEVMVVPCYVISGNLRKYDSDTTFTGHATGFCTRTLFPKMASVWDLQRRKDCQAERLSGRPSIQTPLSVMSTLN